MSSTPSTDAAHELAPRMNPAPSESGNEQPRPAGPPLIPIRKPHEAAATSDATLAEVPLAEERLRQSEERFRVALHGTPILVYSMDRDLRVRWIHNPPATLTREDVLGRTAEELLGDASGSLVSRFFAGVLATGLPDRARFELPALDLGIWDLWSEPEFDVHGAICGVIGAGMDVTDLVRARREAEEANQARDRFLSMIAHDLRTPLTSIIGWSSLLSAGLVEPELLPTAASSMQTSARLLQKLVDELLDLTRLINDKIVLSLDPVDVRALVQDAVTAIRPAAADRKISVRFTADDRENLMVAGDADRLQQIFGNLLSNAVKFTEASGSIHVMLATSDDCAVITVRDTGRGIDPQFLPRVFDRFSQQKNGGGLGLGLAIVRELVERHGGSITAASEGLGHGATFTVRLPLLRK